MIEVRRLGPPMTVVARMLTQDQDGIPGYMAHPDGPGLELGDP